MSNAATAAYLEALAARLNRATDSPENSHSGNVSLVGHYHISSAYDGVSLLRCTNPAGGALDVFSCGHVPKRSLADRMLAFLAGVAAVKGVAP